MVSEVLVMLVVSIIWCFGLGLNMWFWLLVDSCVYSGRIFVLWYCWCDSSRCVLWILCLLGRNISMLLGLLLRLWLVMILLMMWVMCLVLFCWIFVGRSVFCV